MGPAVVEVVGVEFVVRMSSVGDRMRWVSSPALSPNGALRLRRAGTSQLLGFLLRLPVGAPRPRPPDRRSPAVLPVEAGNSPESSRYLKQSMVWSFTIPTACMKA